MKEIQKFRETSYLKHIYKTKLGKACFVHDVAYSHSKDLTKRTISDEILKGRVNKIARNRGDESISEYGQ